MQTEVAAINASLWPQPLVSGFPMVPPSLAEQWNKQDHDTDHRQDCTRRSTANGSVSGVVWCQQVVSQPLQ